MEISKYRVRQCSQCSGDLEFVCITCQSDLCQRCKKTHLTDLSNKDHDVISNRKTRYHYLQEICEKHPGMAVEKYCQTCTIPLCIFCRKHRKHRLIDLRTAYKQKRIQNGQTIHIIQKQVLLERQFIFGRIKTDFEKCHAISLNYQFLMYEKAQKLKKTLGNRLPLSSSVHRCVKQKTELINLLVWIQCIETKYEKSSYKPIDFLKIIKKENLCRIKKSHIHRRQQLKTGSFQEVLIKLLAGVELTEKGKRCVGNYTS